jgi:hypothetical protein
MLQYFVIIAVALIAPALADQGSAASQPLPQPKPPGPGGSCPSGYVTSGSFCMPTQGAQDAIPKPQNGVFSWTSSGNYCLHSGGPSSVPRRADA